MSVCSFTEELCAYITEHHLKENTKEWSRFQSVHTCWLDASLFGTVIPYGNAILPHKLKRVSEWLAHEPLDVRNQDGKYIGVPTVAMGCTTGSFKLMEGNHRVHVLINQCKAERIPVQLTVVEDSWDAPICEKTAFEEEQEAEDFNMLLVDALFNETGETRCCYWSRKEVWRAALHRVAVYLFKPHYQEETL